MKTYALNPDYPMNLLRDVVEFKNKGPNQINFDEIKWPSEIELIPSVEYVIYTLEEKEVDTVHYRYVYQMSYRRIGEIMGVSSSAIEYRLKRILRKFGHPSRFRILQHGMLGSIELERKELQEKYEKYIKKVGEKNVTEQGVLDVKYQNLLEDDIGELNLSVRSWNCLCRADLKTIKSVVDAFRTDYIMRVRNLGPKSMKEIREKIIAYGIPEEFLAYDKNYAEWLKEKENEERKIRDRKNEEELNRIRLERQVIREEKEKENAVFMQEVEKICQALRESQEKGLETLFHDEVLQGLKEYLKEFKANERIVSLAIRTELYDPAEEISPYQRLFANLGVMGVIRDQRREIAGLTRGDIIWNRYLFKGEKDGVQSD